MDKFYYGIPARHKGAYCWAGGFLIILLGCLACPVNPQETPSTESKDKVIHKLTFPSRGWIAETEQDLTKQVNGFLARVKPAVKLENKIVGLVAPHAGYRYSGQCAAYAYQAIKEQTCLPAGRSYKRVIIMGPSHFVGFHGIAVTKATHFQTPLGEIPVDTTVCKNLLAAGGLFVDVLARTKAMEHSVDIQMPFLQKALKGFKIVPLIVGDLDGGDYQKAADIIQQYVDDDTLVIASSDFTHYGLDHRYVPFKDNIKENIKKLDFGAIKHIKEVNPTAFLNYIKKTKATICGRKPIALLMTILPDSEGTLLHYYTSGDLPRCDFTNSVSYASIALTEYHLNKDEQSTLIKLARDTLKTYLKDKKRPDISGYKLTPRLKRKRGVFVTLKNHGRLRGCIGRLFEPDPLSQGVIDYTIHSANDNRFWRDPITAKEEPELDIEISVLSSLKRVNSYKDIVVGKHGVYLVKGGHKAVYLPQVAPEQGWNRTEMLKHLCQKAGLSKDAWKDKETKFYVYTGQVFEEE